MLIIIKLIRFNLQGKRSENLPLSRNCERFKETHGRKPGHCFASSRTGRCDKPYNLKPGNLGL